MTAYPPILDSIRARHARYGWSVPTGEWGLIQSQHRRLLRAALDADNVAALDALLRRMFRGDLAFGLVSMPRDPATTLPRQVTWRLALWAKTTDAPDLRRLAAPDVGAPVVIYADGPDTAPVPLMPDVCRFDTYARRIARVLPPDGTVLEFGGGYGGTALQVLRSLPTARVVLCDLPETLYLAAYYLAHALPEVSLAWWDEDPTAQIVLLPAADLSAWRGPTDLVFAAHTFSGLDRATTARYLAWLPTSGARWFYHDDATEAVTGIWLTDTIPETLASDVVPPAPFVAQWCERTPWTGIGDRFCEFFYARVSA